MGLDEEKELIRPSQKSEGRVNVNNPLRSVNIDKKGLFNKKGVNHDDTELVYDRLLTEGRVKRFLNIKEQSVRVATAFLFERVGRSEIFVGAFPLLRGNMKGLGTYTVIAIGSKYNFVDVPRAEDFTPANNSRIGKVVEIVKFAEDDFRVRGRLNETYYSIDRKPKMINKQFCTVCKEEISCCNCPEDQRFDDQVVEAIVQEKDEDGKDVFEYVEVAWEEPKGVAQEGRDAIREGNEYVRKMEEFKKGNPSMFEKYGGLVVPVVGMAIVAVLFIIAMKMSGDNLVATTEILSGEMRETREGLTGNGFVDKITGNVIEKQRQQANPPPPS